jgi:SAM-dependent methyltransferase
MLVMITLHPKGERLSQSEWERSRTRWRAAPGKWSDLTWGHDLTGESFIDATEPYAAFAEEKHVLEVGPGYGRLLRTCLDKGIPFATWRGLELSGDTCEYLRKAFPLENVEFVQGDVETTALDRPFDIVLSSAVFQHLFPSIEPALEHLRDAANPGCAFCIDLPEGTDVYWESETTFIHRYTRPELAEILNRVELEQVEFQPYAEPGAGLERLLVVARKPL